LSCVGIMLNKSRVWSLASFLVGLRTYQHHGYISFIYCLEDMFRPIDHHQTILTKPQQGTRNANNIYVNLWDAIRLRNVLKYIKNEYKMNVYFNLWYIKLFYNNKQMLANETKLIYIIKCILLFKLCHFT